MKYKFLLSLIFIFRICYSGIAQKTLSGVVMDSDSRAVLPFVNIGIKQKNIGTSSLPDGSFNILIPKQNENDTLSFSMVGYEELHMPVPVLATSGQKPIQLKVKATELNTVTVVSGKLVERKFGIKNHHALIHFIDGSTNQNDVFEIAQVIKLDTTPSKVTSVNLYLAESRNDSGTFRINFYALEDRIPTTKIVEKNIVQTHAIRAGWLTFNLAPNNIYLRGSFVVGIEFIPTEKKNSPIYYDVKLGGSASSFTRASSLGEWNIPPHHYCLFITALVSDDKNKTEPVDTEEKETIPTTNLYSEFVKDSFSVFIRLPEDYTKKNQNFPVIFLLDGNAYFDLIANAMKNNSNRNAILVGIGYKDFLQMNSLRDRDFTFPKALPQDSFALSGGAPEFLSFIEHELIPYVDSAYRTEHNNRTLMGHSLGGYFTIYALEQAVLFKHSAFKNFVAASPSLDYCDRYLIKQLQGANYDVDKPRQTLFMTFGGREDSEEGTETSGIDNFNSFATLLSDKRFKNIQFKSEVFPSSGHLDTAVPTFTKALRDLK